MRRALALMLLLGACWVGDEPRLQAAPMGDDATEAVLEAEQPADAGTTPPPAANSEGDTAENEVPSARARYNLALDALNGSQFEEAATQLLSARDEAGPDGELRYRAAFNLGVALAGQADTQQGENPEQAIETLRSSAAWFNDAVRLAPEGDDDARINLELVLRRVLTLADQLNDGKALEKRLDRIIDDQRGLRDRIRRLLAGIEREGAGAEPVGFQREFEELATFERTLLAEAGSIGDLAAEERGLIEQKDESERNQEESVRAFQLQSMDAWLQSARQSLSDTRRRLRRLDAERGHRRADAALEELKRAREQFLDPVTVLKAVAQDETSLLAHTRALAATRGGVLQFDTPAAQAPPWLTTEHLDLRQQAVAARTAEVLARLQAGVDAGQQGTGEPAAGADPRQARILQAAGEAVPLIEAASDAMSEVSAALSAELLDDAMRTELTALQALFRAIERFAGLRDLIELAFADQNRIVGLLTPPEDGAATEALATEERMRMVGEATSSNQDRLTRLQGLIQDELGSAEAEAAQAAGDAGPDPAQLETIRERFTLAEELRGQAVDALGRLDNALSRLTDGATDIGALTPAADGLVSIEELRRLFFSIVEHLQELLRDQTDTHDRAATLQFEAALDELVPELGLVNERQTGHAVTGDALAQALAQQADAAGASEDPQAQEASGNLAEAAGEVRSAAGRMQGATALFADAVARAGSMSPDLEPGLDDQLAAIEHLETAIALLQPPQEQQNQDDENQQQDQQQQQQQAQNQPEEQEMSQRQALRRLQAIRDREAERQRQRENEQLQPEPVEKDW